MTRSVSGALAAAVLILGGCTGEAEPGTAGDVTSTEASQTGEPTQDGSSPGEDPAPTSESGQTKEPRSAKTGKATEAASPRPYLPVPQSVTLTVQGVDLRLGDKATIAWQPRPGVVGALDITVARLERAPIEALSAFRLDRVQRGSSLFYVRGELRNVGATNLAGVNIPLYAVDGRDRLVEATPIHATYRPCASAPLPTPFNRGRRLRFCLLYLVPDQGRLAGVSFRPTQQYNPIIWTGRVQPASGA